MNAKLVRSGRWKCSFSFVYTHMTQQCGKSSMQKCMLHFQECLSVEWLVFLRFVGVHMLVKPTNHCCFDSCRQAVDTVLHLVWSLTVLQLAAATAVAIATRSIYTWSAIAMKSKTSCCVNSFFFFSITAIGNRLLCANSFDAVGWLRRMNCCVYLNDEEDNKTYCRHEHEQFDWLYILDRPQLHHLLVTTLRCSLFML